MCPITYPKAELHIFLQYCSKKKFSMLCILIVSCFRSRDNPTKEEKMEMAQSIINAFPILKDSITGGYVSSWK